METALPPAAAPPAPSHRTRFDSVDELRGVAVCGILVMNIVSFGMPAAAYLNPRGFLGDLPSTHLVHGLTHILADQKFMGLFSLLFGSSAMLLINRLRASGLGPARYYYSRIWWLMVFGLLHGLFLWEGDILFYYGLCGLFLYPLWRVPPRLQFALGLAVFAGAIAIDRMGHSYIGSLSGFSLEMLTPAWSPTNREVEFESLVRLSGYREQLGYRSLLPLSYSGHVMDVVSLTYLAQGIVRALGLMLIGMAFYSWGIVTAQRSLRYYHGLIAVGLTLGLPIAGVGLWQSYRHDWDVTYAMFAGLVYNHVATPLLVTAYVGIVMILYLDRRTPFLRRGLGAIGRMAFTNYIGQSIMGTLIFYGYGLGWFGQLNRLQLLFPVIAVWVLQFYFSLWWLRRFRYGPLEWVWRALAYFRIPQFRSNNERP